MSRSAIREADEESDEASLSSKLRKIAISESRKVLGELERREVAQAAERERRRKCE
jgi:hypothetical protein